MDNLIINLENGSFEGTISISCDDSKIQTIHMKRNAFSLDSSTLEYPGLYFLVLENGIYVGISNDTISSRIINTHTNHIQNEWHSVIGFAFISENIINTDQLKFLENAMCEYVYNEFENCLTRSPSRRNCNSAYRREHYSLNTRNTCRIFYKNILDYISILKHLNVLNITSTSSQNSGSNNENLLFRCTKRGCDSYGHLAPNSSFIVNKNSKISDDVSDTFVNSNSGYYTLRIKLIEEGVIRNNKFTRDYRFHSPSAASTVVLGRSSNGKTDWKTSDGKTLKELIN